MARFARSSWQRRRGTQISLFVDVSLLRSIVFAGLVGTFVAGGQSLRGSRSSVNRVYSSAVGNDLELLNTSKGVYRAVSDGELVMIGVTTDHMLEKVKYPFVLPEARHVLYSFAARYRASCGERLIVTSAARPRVDQPRNASPKSVHPTSMAVDFRKPAGTYLTFMRTELLTLEGHGVLKATEEKHPRHFHVAVLQRGGATSPTVPAGSAAATTKPETRSPTISMAQPATYAVRRGETDAI